MVSPNEVNLNLRETHPLSGNILHSPRVRPRDNTGQRPNPNGKLVQEGYRGWILFLSNHKGGSRLPNLPCHRSGYCKERDWFIGDHHLNNLVESTFVNVGGFYQNVKVSSPPRIDRSVGGVIVVRARESRVQGEGRQEANIFLIESNSKSCECSGCSER